MVLAPRICLLQYLRHRRYLLAVAMFAVFAGWFVAALGQCLMTAPYPSAPYAAGMADMHEPANGTSTMPCADCTMGSDSSVLEATAAVPVDPKLGSLLALVVISTLLAINFPKTIPIPPRPRLPKRPRTLKFYALRI